MGKQTAISWTDATWNPWRGCTKVSEGCDYCYMFRDQTRYGGKPEIVMRAAPATFNAPRTWHDHRRVFTCSWSDFFHPDADAWRADAWTIVRDTPRLTYQILTKRVNRVRHCLPADWGDGYANVWLGTSVERDSYGWRAMNLANLPARVRFLSCEPLLGPLTHLSWWLGRGRIQWVIVGGESGGPEDRRLVEQRAGAWIPTPEALEWVRTARDQCVAAGVPFFFKQWGGPLPTSGGDLLDGRQWHEFPAQESV